MKGKGIFIGITRAIECHESARAIQTTEKGRETSVSRRVNTMIKRDPRSTMSLCSIEVSMKLIYSLYSRDDEMEERRYLGGRIVRVCHAN